MPCEWSVTFLYKLIVVLVNMTLTEQNKYDFDSNNIHITDFGVNFVTQLANSTGGYTTVPGSVEYMAPEILKLTNIIPTTMSDMWTIGCIGYEMCLGVNMTTMPENFQEIRAYIDGQPLNLRRVPARFSQNVHQVIHTCMAINPNQRFSAAQLRDYINSLLVIMNTDVNNTAQNFTFLNPNWS
jgi:serine/threonine protein kinase